MWHRLLNTQRTTLSSNRVNWGKKQPVKSMRIKPISPYHFYKTQFTLTAEWRYCVLRNNVVGTLHPTLFSPLLNFISPLPISHLSQGEHFSSIINLNPQFYATFQTFYLPQETWRHSLTKTMWAVANVKTSMRLRFRGKGYYLYKSKRNTLSFRFGYSHRVYRYSGIMWFRLLSKTEILIWGRSKLPVWRFAWSIKRIRPYNKYTGKGIRFTRQITYKKLGKIGSYR